MEIEKIRNDVIAEFKDRAPSSDLADIENAADVVISVIKRNERKSKQEYYYIGLMFDLRKRVAKLEKVFNSHFNLYH